MTTDLSVKDKVGEVFVLSQAQFGPVQVLVVNHAISPKGDIPLADITLDQCTGTLQTNLTSSFLVFKEYLRGLREQRAAPVSKEKAGIVLIGSTAGKYGEAGNADYAASKCGTYDNADWIGKDTERLYFDVISPVQRSCMD